MPWKTITAMLCILTLVLVALLKGINGAALATGCSAIAGLAGYTIGRVGKSQRPPSP